MADLQIRGLSEATVARIDAEAAELGPSRNEFLPRRLEEPARADTETTVTAAGWGRSAETFADLSDAGVMDAAWR